MNFAFRKEAFLSHHQLFVRLGKKFTIRDRRPYAMTSKTKTKTKIHTYENFGPGIAPTQESNSDALSVSRISESMRDQ